MIKINKILFAGLTIILIFLIACKPVQKEVAQTTQTGDVAVDAVGNDLNDVADVDQDLSTNELGDIDTGLADVEKI